MSNFFDGFGGKTIADDAAAKHALVDNRTTIAALKKLLAFILQAPIRKCCKIDCNDRHRTAKSHSGESIDDIFLTDEADDRNERTDQKDQIDDLCIEYHCQLQGLLYTRKTMLIAEESVVLLPIERTRLFAVNVKSRILHRKEFFDIRETVKIVLPAYVHLE